MAKELGIEVDKESFDLEMNVKKKSSKEQRISIIDNDLTEIISNLKIKSSIYIGDKNRSNETLLENIIQDNKLIDTLKTGEEGILIFPETCFYAESGGQIGDKGIITFKSNTFEVSSTIKVNEIFLHKGKVTKGMFKVKDKCLLKYNFENRESIRKNHSTAHLLQQSLIDILGDHISQAGSSVTAEKVRFDFNHFQGISKEELQAIEVNINKKIQLNLPINIKEMSKKQAVAKGAKAFFEEKYGDVVRVISMGDYSIELCGGSHVSNTSEIIGFKITNESSIASGIRRIEGITGNSLLNHYLNQEKIIKKLEENLNLTNSKDLITKVSYLQETLKSQVEQLNIFQIKELKRMFKDCKKVEKDISFYLGIVNDFSDTILKQELERLKNQDKDSFIFFINEKDNKLNLMCGLGEVISKRFHAGKIVKEAAIICEGGGGGRKDFAQAGGKNIEKVDEIISFIKKKVKK